MKNETKKFLYNKTLHLESGATLPQFELAYQTWGKMRYNDQGEPNNVIWVCHALTANADVVAWWEGLFGSNKLFDPERHFIVCANILGSSYGSTNPLSINPDTQTPYYHSFPVISIRDIAKTLDLLRQHLGITRIKFCLGGSMGGQQVLEWAIEQPTIFDNLFLIATNAKHSPWGIAFNESQRMAIENDGTWQQKDKQAGMFGMKVARSIALISYRNYLTYEMSQAEEIEEKMDDFKASSYQRYQGEKLVRRNFHAFSYWYLSKAMDSHNVGRNRESIEKALSLIQAPALVVGIKTDLLFPTLEQKYLATYIPHAEYKEINSVYGHDGFLMETDKIQNLMLEKHC